MHVSAHDGSPQSSDGLGVGGTRSVGELWQNAQVTPRGDFPAIVGADCWI